MGQFVVLTVFGFLVRFNYVVSLFKYLLAVLFFRVVVVFQLVFFLIDDKFNKKKLLMKFTNIFNSF